MRRQAERSEAAAATSTTANASLTVFDRDDQPRPLERQSQGLIKGIGRYLLPTAQAPGFRPSFHPVATPGTPEPSYRPGTTHLIADRARMNAQFGTDMAQSPAPGVQLRGTVERPPRLRYPNATLSQCRDTRACTTYLLANATSVEPLVQRRDRGALAIHLQAALSA